MLDLLRPPSEWTFVGRKDELDFALRELEAGRPGLVITATPGAGRTRLAQEIAKAATARGLASTWLSAAQASDPAWLERLAEPREPAPLRAALLVVDDAHALEPVAAKRIARLASSGGVFLVLTVLAGRPGPDAIRSLWKEGVAPLVELRPLSESDVGELVESALATRAERGTLRLLWRASEGNLVLLRELLREGLRRGVLERRADVFRWSGPLVLSAALRELARERVAQLPASAYRTLEEIASAEPCELALLGSALDDGSLELLEREGLIAIERDGLRRHVRATQPICAEHVREATPRSRLARIHRKLGLALVHLGLRRPDDRLRAAIFLLDGDPAAAAPFLVDAAEQAWSRGQAPVAERLARAALHGRDGVQARHILAEALADQGRFDEGLAEWAALEATELDERTRARAATGRAAILAFARGRTDEAREVLERASAGVESDDARRLLDAMRISVGVGLLPPERIVAEVERLLLESDLPALVEARLLMSLFSAAVLQGQFQSVLDRYDRALRAAAHCRVGFPLGELWIRMVTFFSLLYAGDLDAAERLAAERREAHADDASAAARSYWTHTLGITALWRGRVKTATQHLTEAAAALLEYDNGARQLALFDLAAARAMAGAAEGAERALSEADASRPSSGALLPYEVRGRACVLAMRGERSAARALLSEAASGFLGGGRIVPAILTLHDAVRYGAGMATARALANAAASTDGPLLRALAAFGTGLATRDAHALDAASERLAALGVHFHAAEAARAACEQHANEGRAAPALASRRAFERLAALCEGASFPLLVHGDPLTRREREVAERAARGASDREIAARLSISVRTVNAHLRSVYGKLGVGGRLALQALLAPRRGEPREPN